MYGSLNFFLQSIDYFRVSNLTSSVIILGETRTDLNKTVVTSGCPVDSISVEKARKLLGWEPMTALVREPS